MTRGEAAADVSIVIAAIAAAWAITRLALYRRSASRKTFPRS